MKKIILLSLTLLFTSVWAQINKTTSLAGKITDGETGEELIGAGITVYQEGVLKFGTSTDFEGNYAIVLSSGTYDVEVSYIGYSATRITDVIVKEGQANKLDIQLGLRGQGVNLDEIVVNAFKVPLIQQDNTTQGGIISSQEIAKLPTKNIGKLASSTAGLTQLKEGDAISVRGSRSNGTDVYVDGIRVSTNAVATTPTTKKKRRKRADRKHTPPENALRKAAAPKLATPKAEKLPTAGQLTAGEWKDLDNWNFWDKLMKDQQFAKHQDTWKFYPNHRYELKLSDKDGQALSHIKVNLLNEKQEVVWSAISDNKGSVCLWGNLNGGDDEQFEFEILHPDGTKKLSAIEYSKGLNSVQLPPVCSASKKVDIAFVVDVSGSMHDEIRYLRSEINDVVERASSDETELQVRTGAVYYSGKNEKQFLNSSPLTKGTETTAAFLRNSPLGGGSNEAVNLGLGLAVRELDWDDSAMARLVFVLLDEAPSIDEETIKDLHKVVEEAAQKGIKVIPVAASGTNKSLEFLLKFMAMGTNSTYTFLTNHSGIGGNHIAPEAGSYNVETLNDLLVRLIIENAEYHDCETVTSLIPEMLKSKTAYRKATRSETNKKIVKQIRLFPNPASDHVNIDLEKAADMIIVSTMQGKVVAQYPKMDAGQIRLQTSDWAAGVYLVHIWTEEGYGILKLVVTQSN